MMVLVWSLQGIAYFLYFFDWVASLKFKKWLELSVAIVLCLFAFNFYSAAISGLHLSEVASVLVVPQETGSEEMQNVLGIQDSVVHPSIAYEYPAPAIDASAVLAVDVASGDVLYSVNPDTALAPASTSKLMTALVALDMYSLDEILSVPEVCTTVDSTKAWLPADEKFKVETLVRTLLIASAGDSACVLAYNAGFDNFVGAMNTKAQEFGMSSTYFTNPIGLDGVDDSHLSTASDLYKLTRQAMTNDFVRNTVNRKEFYYSSVSDNFSSKVTNTNELLWQIPGTIGVKTGTTLAAGQVLIYEYDKDGKDIVIIVMNSQDRFNDTKKILNWILSTYSWI